MRYAPLILIVSCATPPAPPSDSDPRNRIDPIVQKALESGKHVGLVVGILKGDRSFVFGYGRISSDNPAPPDGDTVFEIGSITKAFTGVLLAQFADDRDSFLDDPVRTWLPEGFHVPSRNGKEITLKHLATHTSGLPAMPGNFWPADPANPYADYTVVDLKRFLAAHSLRRDPGGEYEYSNLGFGLLGYALASHTASTYEELVTRMICAPLGMKDTRIALSDEMKTRLAPGHSAEGCRVSNWDIPTLAGAGALRSTANDMLKFLAANVEDSRMRLSHVPYVDLGKNHLKVGLGWHLLAPPEGTFVWQNGETGGYHGFAGFEKRSRLAIVVLSNTSEDVDTLALTILTAIAR